MRIVAATFLFFAAPAAAEGLDGAVRDYLAAAEDGASRWRVSGNLGLALTQGNSESFTVTSGLDATRSFDPWRVTLKAVQVYARTEGVESANEAILTERLERALSERAWLFQELLLEHDEREELDYRIQLTLGYKRLLKKTDRLTWHAEAGGGVLHEEFRVDPETEAILQFGTDFVWKITDKLTYTQRFVFYPSLSESGEFRFLSESVFTTPLGEKVDLRLSIIDKFDSNPIAGVEENDLLVTLTLQVRLTKGP